LFAHFKRRGSRLLIRLHRFELRSPYPGQLKIGAVNQVVCVSKHYARLTREYTGWPDTKVATVPNALDIAQLDRPRAELARFALAGNPKYLLVETPYGGWPLDLPEKLFRLLADGITPVLAHPERNAGVRAASRWRTAGLCCSTK